ncbi:hypothetical protein D3C78_1326670 [compost metagenome]
MRLCLQFDLCDSGLSEDFQRMRHGAELISTLETGNGKFGFTVGQTTHSPRDRGRRAGDRAADEVDPGKKTYHGQGDKSDDDRNRSFRRSAVRESACIPLLPVIGGDFGDDRQQGTIGGGDSFARLLLLQHGGGVKAERGGIYFQCIHDALTLGARPVFQLHQRLEGFHFRRMFRHIGRFAPQDEILLVPSHHQHAGADFGIGDDVDEFLDGMHAIAHGAFETFRGG